jgi:hypothetical protein
MGVKIKGSFQTEIYVTKAGYVGIKQPDPMGGEDSTILLSADQLPLVIKELQALFEDRLSWEGDMSEETAS